ncbi:SDR family oxidoreductase, partial [Streptomyces sioyaensis]|uniref:SDR family oxidoreductase n=1 Tax=Streptomyces sioyaensis TaxID=67364 RepID=UPI0033EABA24
QRHCSRRPASDQRINQFTPLGRRATVEEIAVPYAFLASPAAAYVTGTILAVDSGIPRPDRPYDAQPVPDRMSSSSKPGPSSGAGLLHEHSWVNSAHCVVLAGLREPRHATSEGRLNRPGFSAAPL